MLLFVHWPRDAGAAFVEVPGGLVCGPSPVGVLIKDLDRDGFGDIVVAVDGEDVIKLFRNNGGGLTYGLPGVVPGPPLVSLGMADLNLDNLPDLIMPGVDSMRIAMAVAAGVFGPSVSYALLAQRYARDPVVGDLDHNGGPDVVVPVDRWVLCFMNNGSGVLAQGVIMYGQGSEIANVALVDLNSDNHLDLLFAAGSLYRRDGDGDGTFRAPVEYDFHFGIRGLETMDADNDGDQTSLWGAR